MGFVQEATENHIKKKVEEALCSKMKQKALKVCDRYTEKYAECAAGRTLSVVWKCRKQANELNECRHQYSGKLVIAPMVCSIPFLQRKMDQDANPPNLNKPLEKLPILTTQMTCVLEQMKKEYTLQQEVNAPSSL